MVLGPGRGPHLRARIAGLKLAHSNRTQEAEGTEAARRLDADEVGRRADRHTAERDARAGRVDGAPAVREDR